MIDDHDRCEWVNVSVVCVCVWSNPRSEAGQTDKQGTTDVTIIS